MQETWIIDGEDLNVLFDNYYDLDQEAVVDTQPINSNYKLIIGIPSTPLSKKDEDFLSKILAAKQVSIKDCKIEASQPIDKHWEPTLVNILIFDSSFINDKAYYEPHNIGQRMMFYFDSLTNIQNDKSLKVKLWNNLKNMKI